MAIPYYAFKFNTKALGLTEPVIRLYPLVCLHVGSRSCDMKFIMEHIKRIESDPAAFWVYMGDGGECAIKHSKGDSYGQLLNPQQQMDCLVDILSPIASKGLFGVRGNHGARIYKETGFDFDHTLMARLSMPYFGVAGFTNFRINRSSYDCYWHHGIDSGVALQSKVNKGGEHFQKFIDADAIFTAHSHICVDLPPKSLLQCDNVGKKVVTKLRRDYICGCAYDSRQGYAQVKGYPPLLPAWMYVEFSGKINGGYPVHHMWSRKFETTADYELDHSYTYKYLMDDHNLSG